MQLLKLAILALLLALTACTAEDDTDQKADREGMITQAVDAQLVPKTKAEELEQKLQEDFEKQQQEIDQQSGDQN